MAMITLGSLEYANAILVNWKATDTIEHGPYCISLIFPDFLVITESEKKKNLLLIKIWCNNQGRKKEKLFDV